MHFDIFLFFGYSVLLPFLFFACISTQGIYYLISVGNYPISQSVCTAYELFFKKQSPVYNKLGVRSGH